MERSDPGIRPVGLQHVRKQPKDPYPRHLRLWRFLYALAHRYVTNRFRIEFEELNVEGPIILVPNHVTNWDPLIVGMSLKKKQCYFVATEHIFRLGFLSRLLNYVFAPIARPKGGSSLEAVREMMGHLRKGHSICLFAEGEATWDGKSRPIFPATGKLVRMSGATLVTFRIEGAYLSQPRWGKGLRKGAVRTHVVRAYTPEELKKMTAQEINEAIERDISEDAFERQRTLHTAYRCKAPAEKLESLLYLCPACRKIGTLRSEKDLLRCSCGLRVRYNAEGLFTPSEPFEHVLSWNRWQKEALRRIFDDARENAPERALFSDDALEFHRVTAGHKTVNLGAVRLSQFTDRLEAGGRTFRLSEISDMAMVQNRRLLFTADGQYFEVLAKKHTGTNLLKYLDLYNICKSSGQQ